RLRPVGRIRLPRSIRPARTIASETRRIEVGSRCGLGRLVRHLRASIRIDASPRRVWDLYADVGGSVDWVPFAEEILFVSGPAGLGQVYRERTRLGGMSDVLEW